MSGLHAYAVIDKKSGRLIAINASIAGAGVEAMRHVGGTFVQDDGSPADLETIDAVLAVEPEIDLRTSIQAEASIRIERRLFGP